MNAATPQTIDQLIAYLDEYPATAALADEIDQVLCQRQRSATAAGHGPLRPRPSR